MENKNYDMELAKYIWSILKNDIMVMMSWGVDMDTVKVISGGIQFHVQGFKHKGEVKIQLNEGIDLFEITLISEDGTIVKKIEEVYFDMLVSVIDENIEKTQNYEERISQEYGFLKE